MRLPKLYKEDAKGKIRVWYVKVKGNKITIKSGIKDGKLVISYKYGEEKNINKKNYMSEDENALEIAKTIWRKKIDMGYEPEDMEDAKVIYEEKKKLQVNKDYPIKPMLVQKWKSKDVEDVYIQPKLDGFRCIASYVNGKVILNSRGRVEYEHLKHIKREMKKIFMSLIEDEDSDDIFKIHFDGELYCHGMVRQELSSRVKRKNEAHPREKEIEYHIYDIINISDKDMKYKRRYKFLKNIFDDVEFKYIKLVNTKHLDIINEDIAMRRMKRYVEDGYEGLIVRKSDNKYRSYRSPGIMKYKMFNERDAHIVDVIEGKDGSEGCAVFKLKDELGLKYKYYPRGTFEEKRYWFEQKDMLIGKKISLYYSGETEDKKPECIFNFKFREEWDLDKDE